MKKIAIVIDEQLKEVDGKYYGDTIGYDVVKKYSDFPGKVNLIARVKNVSRGDLQPQDRLLDFDKDINYCEVPSFNTVKGLINNLKSIKKSIKESLQGCNIALVRMPSPLSFLALFQLYGKMPYALDVVVDPYEVFLNSKGIRKIRPLIVHPMQKWYCKHADAITYVTKNSLQKRYGCKKQPHIETYYSDVELPKNFFSDARLTEYGNNKPIQITHVSNKIVGEVKGYKEVILVLKRICDDGYDAKVTFVGDGPDIPLYKEMSKSLGISERVNFAGFVSKVNLRNILLKSDFFILPSRGEGLPRVVAEAMSVSVPCICSNVGGIPELLPPENMFHWLDINGMAKRIEELANNHDKYIENAKLMYETALEYEVSVLTKKRLEFYNALLTL